MKRTIIKNANIINDQKIFESDILIEDSFISKISKSISPSYPNTNIIDAEGKVQYRWVAEPNPGIEPNYDEIKEFLKTL